jgi:peptidoglycan/xylan/chitin deacetylase (PgdA/CDA1 family)
MRLDGYFSSHVVQPLIRSGFLTPDPGIPILMYHSISDNDEDDRGDYYRVCTPPALFREHLQILKEEGFGVVGIGDAIAGLEGDRKVLSASGVVDQNKLGRGMDGTAESGFGCRPSQTDGSFSERQADRFAVITFDDGIRDFYTEAWPILSEFGYGATVFLPTRFIARERVAFQEMDCLTWDEVRMLRQEGVTFGSHSVNHTRLAHLEKAALERELSESRETIERELGEKIEFFSHPYAFPQADLRYIERFRRAILECGYRAAVTTRLGRVRAGDDPVMLKRIPVNGADGAELFRAKLMGAYDWLHGPQQAVQWFKQSKRFFGGYC